MNDHQSDSHPTEQHSSQIETSKTPQPNKPKFGI